jgi:hypothetical protein
MKIKREEVEVLQNIKLILLQIKKDMNIIIKIHHVEALKPIIDFSLRYIFLHQNDLIYNLMSLLINHLQRKILSNQ